MAPGIPAELRSWLLAALAAYLAAVFALAAIASRRIESTTDFVVAGRRLGFGLATGTLLATWFGAGTLMTAADEVRARGVEAATLDPVGAGICLLIAGLVFAGPLWREQLITLPELFERRYGEAERRLAAALMIPTYLGWIAAQFAALAGLLHLFFGVPPAWGAALVALVGVSYTRLGGMWAVALTDALQMAISIVGLLFVAYGVFAHLGDGHAQAGATRLLAETPPDLRRLVPTDDPQVGPWLGVLAAGALGNLASQDLFQRVFSSRSERVARLACIASGLAYLSLGLIPVVLGLAGRLLFGAEGESTVANLAGVFLHPAAAVFFLVTLLSVVLSTIDSALLAPATVWARDLRPQRWRREGDELRAIQNAIIALGLISLALCWAGESAYALLEASYELGMVALLVPLCLAVFVKRRVRLAAMGSMLLGTGLWTLHLALGWESFFGGPWPMGLACLACATLFAAAASAFGPELEPETP